jgi:hypothetical protein
MGSADLRTYIGIGVGLLPPGTSKLRPQLPTRWGRFFPRFVRRTAVLLKSTLIAAAVAMTVPAYAQQSLPQRGITIIIPYSVHVYSADPATPGRLLDDENLQRQNEREQRERIMRQMEQDREAERQEADQ